MRLYLSSFRVGNCPDKLVALARSGTRTAVDPPASVEETYGPPPIWDGLGVLEFSIVPHYDSPDHPESAALGRVAEEHSRLGTAHRTLRDGEVLIIDGAHELICH